MAKVLSLATLLALWALVAALAHSRLLPDPLSVGAAILADIRSGELPFQMACTLARRPRRSGATAILLACWWFMTAASRNARLRLASSRAMSWKSVRA